MSISRLIQLLDMLNEQSHLSIGPCEESLRQKFSELNIPNGLFHLFTSHWPQTPDLAFINYYFISSTGQLFSTVNVELLLPHRLFAIGDATCGDILALDLTSDPPHVVILNHENFDPNDDPRKGAVVVSDSLERFLEAAVNQLPVPSDYYAALEVDQCHNGSN